jgi:tetratricopeptide (TPR) repeat protein
MKTLPRLLASLVLLACPALAQEAREGDATAAPVTKPPPPAEIRSDMIDRLFARLRMSKSDEESQVIEQSIWKLWFASDSPTADVLIAQAVKAMEARETDAALTILDNLIAVHPDFMEAWNRRATLYFMLGKYDESLKDVDKVLDLEPRHFGALAGRGMILREKGDFAGARRAFQDALEVNPHMPGVVNALKELGGLEQPI